jgi:hypothetical protein
MMETAYTVYFPNGHTRMGHAKIDDETPQKALAGVKAIVLDVIGRDSVMEHVRVWYDGKYRDMFVDELGHEKGLPRNENATGIYRANELVHAKPPPKPEALPFIVGPAVLFAKSVWG